MPMLDKVLIANRGEIALRILRACKELGIQTVAVHSKPDEALMHVKMADESVCIGPAASSESYLNVPAIISAAEVTNAKGIHPGYGFLAENAAFARAVVDAGARWIGPHADAVERMGSKIEARRIAVGAGVPVIPGYDESQAPEDLGAAAERIGFPVLVKAAAGQIRASAGAGPGDIGETGTRKPVYHQLSIPTVNSEVCIEFFRRIHSGKRGNLACVRSADEHVLRQTLDSPNMRFRHHHPTDTPSGHGEVFGE